MRSEQDYGTVKTTSGLCPWLFLAQNFKEHWNFLSDKSVFIMLMRSVSGSELVTRKTNQVNRGLALWEGKGNGD